jgi:alpha-N-acetylglucosaminidase
MIANGIYRSIADIDPEALWLQMGWTFKFKPYWTNERQRALFKGVPQDKLLLLDYWCENKEMWVKTESYFGQPFLWCYLNNFGGRNRLIAPTGIIEERVENVLANGGSNFKGVGATLEGFDVNMFGFEYLLDEAWNQHSTLHEWRNNLADRRMGYTSEDARKVYNDYCSRVLDIHRDYDWTMVENRPTMNFSKREKPNPVRFAQIDVWRQLLELESDKDMFIMDVVNVGRQCLADHFYTLWRKFILAYDTYDIKEMKEIGATMKEILKDNADLVACHPVFSLKKWIDDARAWGTTIEEKDFYERNARRLLTIWNNSMSGINDYAGRPWDGLFQSYYIPRWTMFIDEVIAARTAGVEFNEEDFAKRCFEFEERFCELQEPITYPTAQPALPLAKRLFNKYFAPQK